LQQRTANCDYNLAVSIATNLVEIRERIAAAAHRAGRSPADVKLMAVSKTFPADAIREAYEAGQRLFGENRVQEFAGKHAELIAASPTEASAAVCDVFDRAKAEFHLIGHLQSNKAVKAAELFDAVDSIDSRKLLERLNAAAATSDKRLGVLIEINVGGEAAKAGLAPGSTEIADILRTAPSLANIDIRGLMTVPPFTEDPEGARPCFRRLRELRDSLAGLCAPGVTLRELSMGMSHDFEVAIEEGSTCVRVGTAIFGSRG
jgi:pyridoxal phosphate enzyme (YggS family)